MEDVCSKKIPFFYYIKQMGERFYSKSDDVEEGVWQIMTSTDKTCVIVDSLVVLYNISYGQLGNLRWEGSAKHHQLTSGTSLVVRHRLSSHMPPNDGRALPGAALTGFGIPPSIITASRTQHYTSSYTNIYHTWYISYMYHIFYTIIYHTYLCISRVWDSSIVTAPWTLR